MVLKNPPPSHAVEDLGHLNCDILPIVTRNAVAVWVSPSLDLHSILFLSWLSENNKVLHKDVPQLKQIIFKIVKVIFIYSFWIFSKKIIQKSCSLKRTALSANSINANFYHADVFSPWKKITIYIHANKILWEHFWDSPSVLYWKIIHVAYLKAYYYFFRFRVTDTACDFLSQ